MSTIFFGVMMSSGRDTHLRDSDDKFLKYTCFARNRGKFLDADNDDNEEEEENDDDDDDISRDKLGFTTSAGGHLLPLHNHNLWRELVGWRLSAGEGWRETKKISARRGGGGEKHKI